MFYPAIELKMPLCIHGEIHVPEVSLTEKKAFVDLTAMHQIPRLEE
jgi:dihydroorotase